MPNTGFDNQSTITGNLEGSLGGIVSTKPTAKYASGARTLLKINGKLVGFAFGVSWRIQTITQEINTIDDFMPYELAPQRLVVDGTISALHIPGTSAGTEGWQYDAINTLFQKYITIEVRDSATQQLLFFTERAMIVSRQEDIRVDQLASVSLAWKAIGYRDEREPKPIPNEEAPKKASDPKKTAPLDAVTKFGPRLTK